MTLPDFLVIGAAKAGTTALYEHLRQHPQVYMSRWKEPKFFAFETESDLGFRAPGDAGAPVNDSAVIDRGAYEALFADARGETVLGEATSIYLYVEQAADRILALVPQAKLVAILRNPVDRAFSAYQHLVRDGLEPLDFGAALDAEPERIAQRYGFLWRYTDMGFYTGQLRRYQERFPAEQLLVLLYDDLRADPAATCRRVFRFLSVDDSFTPEVSLELNRSGEPRSRLVHRLLNPPTPLQRRVWDATPRALRKPLFRTQARMTNRNLERRVMPAEQRGRLIEVFRDEVARLEQLLGCDLGHWLR